MTVFKRLVGKGNAAPGGHKVLQQPEVSYVGDTGKVRQGMVVFFQPPF